MIHLVRHGRPLIDPAVPPREWELDPAGFDDVWALRDRLPSGAAVYSSAERKALATAELVTDASVGVIEHLGEQRRGWVDDAIEFADAVTLAFAVPGRPARAGWESIDDCRVRLMGAIRPLAAAHEHEDVVLVGHGTAWTVLVAALTGAPPDLERLRAMDMPDLMVVEGWAGVS